VVWGPLYLNLNCRLNRPSREPLVTHTRQDAITVLARDTGNTAAA